MKPVPDIDHIESLLAQTQCQLCDYPDCRAYAEAIVNADESIDRCLPGGEITLLALADALQKNPEPMLDHTQQNHKTITLAVIREHECIGCTKCIQACPVDAIIGSGKQMHTVITDICNGCELCIPPCPVDCIDTIAHPRYQSVLDIKTQSQDRYQKHQKRQKVKKNTGALKKDSLENRQAAIQAALARSRGKKL